MDYFYVKNKIASDVLDMIEIMLIETLYVSIHSRMSNNVWDTVCRGTKDDHIDRLLNQIYIHSLNYNFGN